MDDPPAAGFSTLQERPSALDTTDPPAASMGPLAGRIFRLCAIVAGVGIVLALTVPLLNLRSDQCGPINCALMQVIGKVLTSLGVGMALGTVAVVSLRARRFTPAALAALIAGPTLFWSVLIVDQWRQLGEGSDRVSNMVATARVYASRELGVPQQQLRPLLTTGRDDWAVVRITRPDGSVSYALLQHVNGAWTPKALGDSFSRAQLRELGAPTNLMQDAG